MIIETVIIVEVNQFVGLARYYKVVGSIVILHINSISYTIKSSVLLGFFCVFRFFHNVTGNVLIFKLVLFRPYKLLISI